MTTFDDWRPAQSVDAKVSEAARRADLRMLTLLSAALVILWLFVKG